MKKTIKNLFTHFVAFRYLLYLEKGHNQYVPLIKRIKYLSKGFSSDKIDLYNLKANNYKNYLPDYHRRKTFQINGQYAVTLKDKNVFERLLKNSNMNIAIRKFSYIQNGNIHLNYKKENLDSLIGIIKQQKQLIIKKISGGGGKGVYILSYNNGVISLNEEELLMNELKEFVFRLDHYLIQEYISSADYSNRIYEGTINSIRILVMRGVKNNEPFIATAVHKFGSENTKPVDNVWNGGMTALVDLNTGVLQKSAYHSHNNQNIQWQSSHPDTGEEIEGTEIPHWEYVKQSVLDLTKQLNFLNYVGWDVAVTPEGIKIIEGNNYSDVNILQIHQPLLIDDRVREFYQHYNIIK